jgi:hypothetical protein
MASVGGETTLLPVVYSDVPGAHAPGGGALASSLAETVRAATAPSRRRVAGPLRDAGWLMAANRADQSRLRQRRPR